MPAGPDLQPTPDPTAPDAQARLARQLEQLLAGRGLLEPARRFAADLHEEQRRIRQERAGAEAPGRRSAYGAALLHAERRGRLSGFLLGVALGGGLSGRDGEAAARALAAEWSREMPALGAWAEFQQEAQAALASVLPEDRSRWVQTRLERSQASPEADAHWFALRAVARDQGIDLDGG